MLRFWNCWSFPVIQQKNIFVFLSASAAISDCSSQPFHTLDSFFLSQRKRVFFKKRKELGFPIFYLFVTRRERIDDWKDLTIESGQWGSKTKQKSWWPWNFIVMSRTQDVTGIVKRTTTKRNKKQRWSNNKKKMSRVLTVWLTKVAFFVSLIKKLCLNEALL
jgi:hypothetical protein